MATTYVSPVSGEFIGRPRSHFSAPRRSARGGRIHSGADWQAANGSAVHAMTAGRVVYAGNHRGYGAVVDVLGVDGNIHRYATHKSISVKIGDEVQQGQPIGKIGEGHLHFEVIPPSSPAFTTALKGQFASTSWYQGQEPKTLNPEEFLGIPRGLPVQLGAVLDGARMTALTEQPRLPQGRPQMAWEGLASSPETAPDQIAFDAAAMRGPPQSSAASAAQAMAAGIPQSLAGPTLPGSISPTDRAMLTYARMDRPQPSAPTASGITGPQQFSSIPGGLSPTVGARAASGLQGYSTPPATGAMAARGTQGYSTPPARGAQAASGLQGYASPASMHNPAANPQARPNLFGSVAAPQQFGSLPGDLSPNRAAISEAIGQRAGPAIGYEAAPAIGERAGPAIGATPGPAIGLGNSANPPQATPNERIAQAFGAIPSGSSQAFGARGASGMQGYSPSPASGAGAAREMQGYASAASTHDPVNPQGRAGNVPAGPAMTMGGTPASLNERLSLSSAISRATPSPAQGAHLASGMQGYASPASMHSPAANPQGRPNPALNPATALSRVAAPQQFGSIPGALSVSPPAAARAASGLQGFTMPQNATASAFGAVPGAIGPGPRIGATVPLQGPRIANLPQSQQQSTPTVQNPSPAIPTVQSPPAFGPPQTVQSKPVGNVPMAPGAIPGAFSPATGAPMNLLAQHQGLMAPYGLKDVLGIGLGVMAGPIPGAIAIAPRAINSLRNLMAGGFGGGAANQATRIGAGLYAGVPLGGGNRIDLSNIGSKMSNAERAAMMDAGRRSRERSGLNSGGGLSGAARDATRGRSGLF